MVLLLDGASAMGRSAIAEQVIADLPSWRHLALEVIEEAAAGFPTENGEPPPITVARKCAQELHEDGLHLFLTMPHSPQHIAMLRRAFLPHCITVHLGEPDTDGYDYSFDSSVHSVKSIVEFLQKRIELFEGK